MSEKSIEQDKPESDYKQEAAEDQVPVDADEPVAEPNEETANSDAQLATDEKEAIDKDNIIEERTRHAKPEGGYKEPGDTEGIPE